MSRFVAKILFVAMVGLFPSMVARAWEPRVELGSVYSPKEIGFSLYFRSNNSDNLCGHLFRAMADMQGVIKGESGTPGAKFKYNRLFCPRYWQGNRGTVLSFFAGPGISLGYVQDSDKGFGSMVALSGVLGWNYCYQNNLSISFAFDGELGCHYNSSSNHDTTLKIYKNGVSKVIMPIISINYKF